MIMRGLFTLPKRFVEDRYRLEQCGGRLKARDIHPKVSLSRRVGGGEKARLSVSWALDG